MKKLLVALMMVLCLVVFAPAMAEEITIAEFDFDTQPAEGWTSYAGTGAIAEKDGGVQWVGKHAGHDGVMYFDGTGSLELFADTDLTPLLTGHDKLTFSFDFYDDTSYDNGTANNKYDLFHATSSDGSAGLRVQNISYNQNEGTLHASRGNAQFNHYFSQNLGYHKWNTISVEYSSDSVKLYKDGIVITTWNSSTPLTEILGTASKLYLGTSTASDSRSFIGYIDNFTISENPPPPPPPPPPSLALNPFNNLGDRRPSLYDGMTLSVDGSNTERAIIPIPENNTITLPSDQTRTSFTIGDTTCSITDKNNDPHPLKKLVGWYNIATGEYYSVTAGPVTVELNPELNNVFYGDWVAASYDNWDGNTSGLLPGVADTSDFIDIHLFDYSELVNIPSLRLEQNGLNSESWKVNADESVTKQWLTFSDYGTYRANDHSTGSIGFPHERNPANNLNNGAYQGLLSGTDNQVLENLFDTSSVPGTNSYVPGINYLGNGNFLFHYNPDTGMYSYDCEYNAAVFQQNKENPEDSRFYVYNTPIIYTGGQNDQPEENFFPLNQKNHTLNKNNGITNYWFGMNAEVKFFLPDNTGVKGGNQITTSNGSKDMIFNFNGDDDMWVLIDGEVVLDIGGIHAPVKGSINFSTGEVIVGGQKSAPLDLSAGDHTLSIYYLERGGDLSNCKIEFNLLPEYEVETPGTDVVEVVKTWEGNPPQIPPTITVELYDANKGDTSPAIKTATFGIDEAGKWAHSFANLPHKDENGNVIDYAIREVSLPQSPNNDAPYFDVDIVTLKEDYEDVWVFTDQSGLKNQKEVVIGNAKGKVLADDRSFHQVEMVKGSNIISDLLTDDEDSLIWTVVPADEKEYPGGKHFYLMNQRDEYLCISSTSDDVHLHQDQATSSVFYLNASGDLQDATTGHRLVATESGFDVDKNIGGNITTESANKVSLYTKREGKTVAYSFTLTNTYVDPQKPTGTLKISKTIEGNATDPDDEFTFSIVLTPPAGQALENSYACTMPDGSTGTLAISGGKGTVKLKDGQSILITLPAGTGYTVTETDRKDYTLRNPGEYTGSIAEGATETCLFTNVRNLYSLTVSKTVKGNVADKEKAFAFTVSLTAPEGKTLAASYPYTLSDGTSGTLSDGKGTISIANGQSFTINGLPVDTKYAISEDSDGYTITAPALTNGAYSGTITTGANEVEFVNELNLYSLTVSKSVTGNAADKTKPFAFTVALTAPEGKTLAASYPYTLSDGASGTLTDGKGTISIANGQSFTINGLPVDTKYAISEDSDGYTITAPALTNGAYSGTITTGTNEVEFVNELWAIDIVKKAEGLADGTTVAPKVTVGDVFSDTLTSGADAKRIYVRPGTAYKVSEENAEVDGYTLLSATLNTLNSDLTLNGMELTLSEESTSVPGLTLINTYGRGSLVISKTISGNATSADDEFSFTVELTPPAGVTLAASYPYTLSDGATNASGSMTVSNGVGVITLTGGHSVSFDLPAGFAYTVTETDGKDYELTSSREQSGTISNGKTSSCSFENVRNRYALSVSKTVKGNVADENDEFLFTVTLTAPEGKALAESYPYTLSNGTNNTPGSMTVSNGVGTITLKGGQSLTIGNLLEGTGFSVSEDSDGYTITAPALTNGAYSGTISTGTNEVEFVNELWAVDIKKEAVGLADGTTVAPKVTVGDVFSDTLTSGEDAKRIYVTPGKTYTVSETDAEVDGYTLLSAALSTLNSGLTVNGMEFTLDNTSSTVPVLTLTNTYGRGGLVITKIISGNATSADDEFSFTVELTPPAGVTLAASYPYTLSDGATNASGSMTVSNGVGVITLTGGHSVSFDLPAGFAYTVTETDGKDYELTSSREQSGTISNGKTSSCSFENVRNRYALSVSKTVKGNVADENDEFLFTVTLTAPEGKALAESYPYTLSNGTNNTPGSMTVSNGVGTITLKGGQSLTIGNLLEGTGFSVSEDSDGYTITAPALTNGAYSGTISTGANEVEFVNELWAVDIEKKAVGLADGTTVAPKVTVGDVFSDTLTSGADAKRIYVTPGKAYSVSEENAEVDGYTLLSAVLTGSGSGLTLDGMEFTLDNTSSTVPVLTLTNTYAQGGLTISKALKGNATSTDDEFTFTVTLTDKDGKPVSGTFGNHTFDANGQCEVILKGDQSVNIQKIPVGVTYTVTEAPAEGYVQTAPTEPATGVISTEPALVSFTNERWAVDIEKKAVGLAYGTTVAPKVTVGDFTIEKLPSDATKPVRIYVTPGKAYEVAEENAEVSGYTLLSAVLTGSGSGLSLDGMEFTLDNTSTEIPVLTLTNTYAQGGLTISKIVKGNAVDENDEFTFTVTLTDKDSKPVSGTFGDHTFDANGQCEVILKGGESVNIQKIPVGVTYTVTEAPAEGYVQTAPTEPATGVISTTPSLASFTNERWAVDIEKKAVGLADGTTVAPKVTVGDVTIEKLPSDATKPVRVYVTPGKAYSVSEENAEVDGYTLLSAVLTGSGSGLTLDDMEFTLDNTSTEIPVLTLTNTYAQGGLTISKALKGNATSTDDEFTFTVTLTDKDGKPVSGTFGDHTFDANGQCEVILKGDQSVNIQKIPVGVSYTVTEAPAEGYVQTAPTEPATGVISTTPSLASFTNERWAIDIEKKAVGLADGTTVAPKVTVGDFFSDILTSGADAKRIYVTPGKAYTVAEENAEVSGYTLLSAVLTGSGSGLTFDGMEFTLSEESTTVPVLTLTNTYAQGGLTISKALKGNAASTDDEFTFTVTLTDKDGKPVSGTFGNHTFTEGKTTVTLKGGESASIKELPVGVTYTVTEAPAAGYVQTAPTEPATGVISTTPSLASFTNERWAVDIEKKAVGLADGTTVAPKVTVGDFTIEKLPSDATKPVRVYVTPGKAYTVAEENAEVDGYTLLSAVLTGSGSGLTLDGMEFTLDNTSTGIPVLTLTNTYAQGGLTISKALKGNATSADDEFTFTVTLTDKDGKAVSGTFGDHTFDANGQCEVILKGGESANFKGLPVGVTYTVTEAPAEGYVQTAPTEPATGVISTEPALVSFTNERWAIDIVKKAEGLADGTTVAPKVTVGDVFSDTLTSGADAKRIYVTPGTAYKVSEENAEVDGYTLLSATLNTLNSDLTLNGMELTLSEESTSVPGLTLINTYGRGSLVISKTISGNATSADDEFSFTVELTPPAGVTLAASYPYTLSDGATNASGSMTVSNGVGVITLTGGHSVSFDLPAGFAYTVTETDGKDYELTSSREQSGTISNGKTSSCSFENVRNRYALSVSKTVKGNVADENDEFLFTVTLTAPEGKALAESYPYTLSNGTNNTPGSMTVSNGVGTITLKGGQSLTIGNLLEGTGFSVSEDSDGYTITAPALTNGAYSGTISTGANEVEFVNELWAVDIEKKAVGLADGTTVTPTVSVGDIFSDTLTSGADAKRIYVTPGKTYTVSETDAEVDGYTLLSAVLIGSGSGLTLDGMEFTLSEESTTVPVLTLANTYSQGGLTISKALKGNATSADDEFTFTVTLTDKDGKPVSGTFGNHTFDANGQCEVILKGGESVNIKELPVGVTYTVTEAPAEGYIQTAPTEPATGVISTKPSLASFTNERWAVDIEKKAESLADGTTVAPKVTVGDFTIEKLPSDATKPVRIYVTPGKAYTVAEENAEVSSYTLLSAVLTGSGSGLTLDGMEFTLDNTSTEIPVLTLTNTYAQGGLTISKTVKGNAADENDEFLFTVTLTDKDGKPVSGTFGDHTFDANGQCKVTLKGGESVNFADLPIGVTYTVSEETALGYVQTAPTEPATGVISINPAVVSFTNVRDVVRLVKVTDPTGLTVAPKVTVTGSDGSVVTAEALTANNAAQYLEIPVKPGVTYTVAESGQAVAGYIFAGSELAAKDAEIAVSGMTFTVAKSGLTTVPVLTLSNSYTLDSVTVTIRKVSTGLAEGIAYPAPKVSIYAANSLTPVWTGTLTPNSSALPVKLLPGTYSVKEVIDEVEDYGFTSVLYVNGAASADKTFTLTVNAANTELLLENFYAAEFSTLTLTKAVTGEIGSKTGFTFRITLTDDEDQPITERFPYNGTMDGTTPVSGVITSGSTVALRDGGSITVKLPLGVHYEVEELDQAGYVLVSSEGEKGIITKDGAKAAFVNKPQYTVTVMKEWIGDTAETRPASIQVQLMLDGKPLGNPVTLSALNGWKHTYTGLDAKGPYTIVELTVAEGYLSTVEEGEENTFVITNSYIELPLPPTGDTAHPTLYLLALVGSAALLMLLRKRRAV